MKRTLKVVLLALVAGSAVALAQGSKERPPDRLDRRVQQLEQTITRLEARLSSLEAKVAGGERGGMMGDGGMMGRGMMGGGMMGGGKPNEQWRSPDAGR